MLRLQGEAAQAWDDVRASCSVSIPQDGHVIIKRSSVAATSYRYLSLTVLSLSLSPCVVLLLDFNATLSLSPVKWAAGG